MLRRLLSNPADADEEESEEPREYFLLSKMQLPPEPFPRFISPTDFSGCSTDSSQSTDCDFYWPNCIPPTMLCPSMAAPPLLFPVVQPFPNEYEKIGNNDAQPAVQILESAGESSNNLPAAAADETQLKEEVKEKEEAPEESCPYCNRSFDPARASLRRHMAQCRRINGAGSTSSPSDSPPLKRARSPGKTADKKPKPPANSGAASAATVDPADPYQCQWCHFHTLYKGNMKRHLICCHQVPFNVLQALNFNVERLRKLALDRPALDELPIQPRRDEKDREPNVEDKCGEEAGEADELQ